MAVSAAITRSARSESRFASASIESAICFSASPPISATMRERSWRSTSKALAVCSFIIAMGPCRFLFLAQLAESAGDVVLRAPVVRGREHLAGDVELDQLAEVHEGCVVGDARRLLHIVRHDHD